MLLLALLAGCDDMSAQRKAKDQGASAFFADGKVDQAPPAGTVARGDLEREATLAQRPPMSRDLLERGQQRYEIYCTPCHGLTGDGRGTVVQRGFPQPPDFADSRLRAAPDRHIVDVISQGYGQMYSYAQRVAPADRWAIAAYIRALQLSRHAAVAGLTPEDRQRLEGQP
jgi:mono/diheme cytochrome c family protein